MYDTQTGKHTNLTDHAGEDRNAVFTPDGQTVYFLSERNGGSFNVYSFPLNTPQSITAVTKFKTHPVRFLSTSSDNTLCYTYDGEIYTQRPGVNPQKVRIDLIRDDQEQISDLNSSKGATSCHRIPRWQADRLNPKRRGIRHLGRLQHDQTNHQYPGRRNRRMLLAG